MNTHDQHDVLGEGGNTQWSLTKTLSVEYIHNGEMLLHTKRITALLSKSRKKYLKNFVPKS